LQLSSSRNYSPTTSAASSRGAEREAFRHLSPAALGRWSARRPRLAIACWLTFVFVCLFVGAATGTKELSNGAVGASARGYDLMDRYELWPAGRELAYLHSGALTTASPAFAAGIAGTRSGLVALGLPVTVQLSPDRHSAIVVVSLTRYVPLERIHGAIQAARRAHPQVLIEETGDASTEQARNDVVNKDLHRVELLAIPVTLVVLLLAFGSLVAALVPLLLGLTAVLAGVGLIGALSQVFPVQDSAKTVIILIGLAVGVDYALFYVVRSREERRRGVGIEEALARTARTSGRTVFVSGTTVAIAMAGMFIAGAKVLNGIAAGTIAVVICAVLGSVTVLPAVPKLLGSRIDRGRIPFLPRLVTENDSRFWRAVVTRVLRRPVVALIVGVALLLALAYPALSLRIAKPSDLALTSQTDQALRALASVRAAFPGAGEPAFAVAHFPPASRPAARRAITRLERLSRSAGVSGAPVTLTANAQRTAVALAIPLRGDGANSASRHDIRLLRDRVVPQTLGQVAGVETAVTGKTAEDVDFTTQIRTSLPYVIGFVLLFAFGVLLVAFRSIVVPVKAVILNLLSVAASYGVLALVFEHHWAQPILGFKSNRTIVSWLPLFLFVVLFGLSMDYHVFVLSRVRELVDRGFSTADALRQSIVAIAPVVSAAALVMVCVFGLFGTLSSLDLKEAGVGLATAVLLDATVIRGVLLPASMAVLGERNWYLPRWLERLPVFELEHSPANGQQSKGHAA
jgi:RND superfamily putative drug exporter